MCSDNTKQATDGDSRHGILQRTLQHFCIAFYVWSFTCLGLTFYLGWLCTLLWILIQLVGYTIFSRSSISGDTAVPPSHLSDDVHSLMTFTVVLISWSTYTIYWWFDRHAPEQGSHPKAAWRRWSCWRYIRDYFPIRLVLSTEEGLSQWKFPDELSNSTCQVDVPKTISMNPFSPSRNYLVGFHPHGIFGLGSVINFGTEANNISERIPGLTPWLTTLRVNFSAPLYRDLLMKFNVVEASFEGLSYLLDHRKCGRTGNLVVVVIGGALEALDARPGTHLLHMERRFGFFKLALITGSDLVPCISFGENNMYNQVKNPPSSRLRSFQEKFTSYATFSPPLFYAKGLLPYRRPITTVLGEPIRVEKVLQPSRGQVSELKQRYQRELNALFARYKPVYDPNSEDIQFI